MFHDYGTMAGMHAFWWIFWIAVVIALVFWSRGGFRTRRSRPTETPHGLLRLRLANGEIDMEEYDKRKVILDRDS